MALCAVVFSTMAQAQQNTPFQPHWAVEAQAGIYIPSGEGSFFGMMSPAFSLNAGYRFSQPLGLRVGVGGFQGKGYVTRLQEYYKYSFVRGFADLLWYPFQKVPNLYFLAGGGLMLGTGNGAANVDVSFKPDYFQALWTAPKAFLAGRLGAGYAFPVTDKLSITAEAVYALVPDAINSKIGGNPDCSVSILAGLKYAFGPCQKKARAKAAAQSQADRLVAEREAAEKAAQARAEAEAREKAQAKAKAEAQAKAKAEAEARAKAEAETQAKAKAEAEARAKAELAASLKSEVLFESNSWKVEPEYTQNLEKIADFLKSNPDSTVKLSAYCDSRYGTPAYNKLLSERRANAVAKVLKNLGVSESQIVKEAVGGTEAFTTKNGKIKGNRAVICEIL